MAGAASVGVHAALFFAVPRAAPVVAVAVAEPRPFEVEVQSVTRSAPRPVAPEPAKVPRAKARAVAPEPTRTVDLPPDPPAPDPGPPALDSAAARVDDAAPPAPAAAPTSGAPPAPSLDTAELSRRLQAVAARCYPAAARRFRQTGEAEVRFCLDAAGVLAEATVSRSSGSDLLDQAARGCVVPGAAPYGAEARGHCFTVPVRFHQ